MEWKRRKAAKICAHTGNIKEAAKICGVSKQTICEWKKDPEFRRVMVEEEKKQKSILDEYQDRIDEALCTSSLLKGREGTGDRRLYYTKRGQLVEKREDTVRGEFIDITGMSDEEIEEARRKLLAAISGRPEKP